MQICFNIFKWSISDEELTLKAEHPFTKELIPIYVSKSRNFGQHADSHIGKYTFINQYVFIDWQGEYVDVCYDTGYSPWCCHRIHVACACQCDNSGLTGTMKEDTTTGQILFYFDCNNNS